MSNYTMWDEELFKRRLLIDGDGVGDDRRINMLIKNFIRWCDGPPGDRNGNQEKVMSLLAQCEFAMEKSLLLDEMNKAQLKMYEDMYTDIEKTSEQAAKEIEQAKLDLKEAKRVRQNRIEYDVFAKMIMEQPDRKGTEKRLLDLQKKLTELKEKEAQLDAKLEMRKKQFSVLIQSVHELKELIEESDQENMMDLTN